MIWYISSILFYLGTLYRVGNSNKIVIVMIMIIIMNKYIIRQLPPIFPVYMSDVYTYITFLNHATPPAYLYSLYICHTASRHGRGEREGEGEGISRFLVRVYIYTSIQVPIRRLNRIYTVLYTVCIIKKQNKIKNFNLWQFTSWGGEIFFQGMTWEQPD